MSRLVRVWRRRRRREHTPSATCLRRQAGRSLGAVLAGVFDEDPRFEGGYLGPQRWWQVAGLVYTDRPEWSDARAFEHDRRVHPWRYPAETRTLGDVTMPARTRLRAQVRDVPLIGETPKKRAGERKRFSRKARTLWSANVLALADADSADGRDSLWASLPPGSLFMGGEVEGWRDDPRSVVWIGTDDNEVVLSDSWRTFRKAVKEDLRDRGLKDATKGVRVRRVLVAVGIAALVAATVVLAVTGVGAPVAAALGPAVAAVGKAASHVDLAKLADTAEAVADSGVLDRASADYTEGLNEPETGLVVIARRPAFRPTWREPEATRLRARAKPIAGPRARNLGRRVAGIDPTLIDTKGRQYDLETGRSGSMVRFRRE